MISYVVDGSLHPSLFPHRLNYFYMKIIISSEKSLFVPFGRHGCSRGIQFLVIPLDNKLHIELNEKCFICRETMILWYLWCSILDIYSRNV